MGKSKPLRSQKSLRRKSQNRPIKYRIYIICEGLNSEPNYIKEFSRLNGNGLVDIISKGGAGVPLTVVKVAIELKKELDLTAKKSRDPLDKLFEVWTIFDRDEHPNIPEAFTLASANDVLIAYSNPCFELWPLLHYKNVGAYLDRHRVQKELAVEHPLYTDKKGKLVCAKTLALLNKYDEAKTRAIALAKKHKQVGSNKANPYTDIHVLLDNVIKYGKNR